MKSHSTTKIKMSCSVYGDTFTFEGYQDKATELFEKWIKMVPTASWATHSDTTPKDEGGGR